MNDRLINYAEVIRLVNVCKRQIQRWIASNIFPKPVIIGRVRLFSYLEVAAFIERMKERR
jgi:predicted DNA-binding transcriptional regulator AlpA